MNQNILHNLITLGLIYPGSYTIDGERAYITETVEVNGESKQQIIVEYQFPNFSGINKFKKILPEARVIRLPFNGNNLDIQPSDFIGPADLTEQRVIDIMNALIKSGSIEKNEYRIAGQKTTTAPGVEVYTGVDLVLLDPVNGQPVYHIGPLAIGENYYYDYFLQAFKNVQPAYAPAVTFNTLNTEENKGGIIGMIVAVIIAIAACIGIAFLLNKVVQTA
jgi:hypothetical protein